MREEAVLFGENSSLVGIITDPPGGQRGNGPPAFLLLNAGRVHRVGLNRLHVRIARSLAAMGFCVLRFDFAGIGDSTVRRDSLPFGESAVSETQEAMSLLQATRNVHRFIPVGICSGATIAFRTAGRDPRVVGAILINIQGHLHDSDDDPDSRLMNRALARHYRRLVFFSSYRWKSWRKLLTGRIDSDRFVNLFRSWIKGLFERRERMRPALNPSSVLSPLAERGVRLLHIYAEGDEGLDYLHVLLGDQMQEWSATGQMRMSIIRGSNHSFTLLESQDELMRIIQDWAGEWMEGEDRRV